MGRKRTNASTTFMIRIPQPLFKEIQKRAEDYNEPFNPVTGERQLARLITTLFKIGTEVILPLSRTEFYEQVREIQKTYFSKVGTGAGRRTSVRFPIEVLDYIHRKAIEYNEPDNPRTGLVQYSGIMISILVLAIYMTKDWDSDFFYKKGKQSYAHLKTYPNPPSAYAASVLR